MPVSQNRVRLFLVRHGEVEANRAFAFVGRSNPGLTETGRQQAQGLGGVFKGMPIDRIVSSPLERCVETAEAIAESMGASVTRDLRAIEQSFGRWEGLVQREVEALGGESAQQLRDWQRDPASAPPAGESLAEVRDRVLGLIDELEDTGVASAVIVTHVGPIKSVVCTALELPLAGAARFFLDPASISVVDWQSRPVVRALNLTAMDSRRLSRWSRLG